MTTGSWGGRRVLVTGGAGFIGSNLVSCLVEHGAHVRVADNLERGRLENLGEARDGIDFLQRDLRDPGACAEACRGVDTVFHLAAKVGGIGYYLNKPGEVLLCNTLLDTNVLEASRQNGVARYVYASSAHVYPIERQARPDAPPLREEDAVPAHPELSYGWAKLLGEKQVEYVVWEGGELRGAILRLVGAYGENQDLGLETGSAIPVFICRAILYPQRQPFVIWGTGEETRSYCYIGDVVEGLLRAAAKLDGQRLLGPLNLGSEGRVTIGALAEQVVAVSGKAIGIVRDTSRPTVIWGQAVDCSKARALLDHWVPEVSLEQGLRRAYAHIERRLERGEIPSS